MNNFSHALSRGDTVMKSVIYAAAILAAVSTTACSSDPVSPGGSDLAGLTRLTAPDATDPGGSVKSDTAVADVGCIADSTAVCPGGFFQGITVGAIVGSDSSDIATRVPDVRVTLYTISSWRGDVPVFGDAVASTTSAADGTWKFATQPAGVYGFTFEPPASSKYKGAWTIGTAHPGSGSIRWWISLGMK
jgi:hypothetical protein